MHEGFSPKNQEKGLDSAELKESDIEAQKQDLLADIANSRKEADELESRFDEITKSRAKDPFNEAGERMPTDPAEALESARKEVRETIVTWRARADRFEKDLESLARSRAASSGSRVGDF